jgi:hypothetical protein
MVVFDGKSGGVVDNMMWLLGEKIIRRIKWLNIDILFYLSFIMI